MSASNVQVNPLGDGRFLVTQRGRQLLAYAVAASDARWVFLDGRVYVLPDETRASRRGRHTHDEAALASPMPATVVLVNVQPGQRVAAGDLLVMLEAMKMEVPVKAPRDGQVKAVACQKGELVQPGVPLLELE